MPTSREPSYDGSQDAPKGGFVFSARSKMAISGFLCLFLSNVPQLAVAEVVTPPSPMISTQDVLNEQSREEVLADIQSQLSREDVQAELAKAGVESKEISARLASLSQQELRDLQGQLETARAGGDILITILVVVLIIFLIKRI